MAHAQRVHLEHAVVGEESNGERRRCVREADVLMWGQKESARWVIPLTLMRRPLPAPASLALATTSSIVSPIDMTSVALVKDRMTNLSAAGDPSSFGACDARTVKMAIGLPGMGACRGRAGRPRGRHWK